MLDFSRIQNYYIACGYTDMRKQIDGLVALVQTQLGAASESGAVGGSSMRVSAAGNMPLQGLAKPPAKLVVMILCVTKRDDTMDAAK